MGDRPRDEMFQKMARSAVESSLTLASQEQATPCYFAHSANGTGAWHTLKDHLTGVAQLARQFMDERPAADEAALAGLLHDLITASRDWAERPPVAMQRKIATTPPNGNVACSRRTGMPPSS